MTMTAKSEPQHDQGIHRHGAGRGTLNRFFLKCLIVAAMPGCVRVSPLAGVEDPGFFDGSWYVVLRDVPGSLRPGFEPASDRDRFVRLSIADGRIVSVTNALGETMAVSESDAVEIGPGSALSMGNDSAGWFFRLPAESGVAGTGDDDARYVLQLTVTSDVATENELPGLIDILSGDPVVPPTYGFNWRVMLLRRSG